VQLSGSLSSFHPAIRQAAALTIAGLVVLAVSMPIALARETVSISRDWRFTKGDPAGLTQDLRYDVRPPIEDAGDGKVADA